MVDAFVNGERVTPTALPVWTEYDRRVLSYDYDVAHLLKKDKNILELRIGNGWYNLLPMKMWGRFNLRKNLPQGTPCVNATLTIARPDGSQTQIATDGDWQAADGPFCATACISANGSMRGQAPRHGRPPVSSMGPKAPSNRPATCPRS